MKIKRILATLLVACMIFGLLPASVLAEGNGRVYIDANTSVNAGESVTLNLNIENNPGLSALTVRVFYKTLTCEKVNHQKDKDNQQTAFAKSKAELEDEGGMTIFANANKNDKANIPATRKDAGWSMASFAYTINDDEGTGRSFKADGAIASLQFAAPSDMETEDVAIEVEILKANDGAGNVITLEVGNDTIHVNGVAPTIKSVAIDPYTATYGQAGEYELKVLSTKDKDITSLVDWAVSPADKGVSVTAGKLTVTAAAPAGTYTVTASGRANESQGTASADFTITKAQIDTGSASVAISGFGKGLPVNGVTTTWSKGLELVSIEWFKDGEKVTSGNFIGSSTYTAYIKFKADANHDFIGTSMSVSGISSKGNSLTRGEDGVHTLTLVLETAAKTALKIVDYPSVNPQAHYGMKLNELTISGGKVIVDGDETETKIEGHFVWLNPDQDVGAPTVDNKDNPRRGFDAKFVPDKGDEYAELPVKLNVDVHKISIDISSVTQWNYTSPLKYNGSEQTVELVIPETLKNKDQIAITYEGNTGTNVGTYNAKATFGVKDDVHYMIYNSNKERTLSWEIIPGDLTPTANPVKSVRYGITTVTVNPSDLGLPSGLTVTATPDNDLVTAAAASADGSVTLTLRPTTEVDADKTIGTVSLTYSSSNYNPVTVVLTVKIINKTEDRTTLQIDVPATVTYGDTVSPSVGESKPEGADDVMFKFFDKDGKQVSDQPFPVGKYKVTASCEDADTIYTAEKEFEVVARELTEENVTFGENLVYTGNELTQTVTVTVNGKPLNVGTDYTVTGLTGTEPGDYTVTVTGKGNYKGEVKKTFTIGKATIPADGINFDAGPYGYTGSKWEPEVTVTFNGTPLTAGTDYTVSYEDNINAGTAKVIITGIGDHFTGKTEKPFTIEKASLSGCTIVPIEAVTYNAKAQTPALTVYLNGNLLQANTDYEVAYTDNTNAGTATATVTGKGNFEGTKSGNFTIKKADLTLSDKTLSSLYTETEEKTADLSPVGFCAGELTTGFTVAIGEPDKAAIFTKKPAPVSGENKVTYQLSGTIGTAVLTVTVTPTSANYNPGTYTLTIEANDKTNVSGRITFESGSAVYTGSGIAYEKATISGLSGSMRYSYTPESTTGASLDAAGLPLTVGTYNVTAVYSDAYNYGTQSATFTITQATPTGTPSFTKIEASGKTLADAALTVGTITPAGTIAWDLPATTEVEANKEYTWTFTPTDTHNYKPLTGRLTPYVVSDMSYLPGVIGNTGSFNFHDVSRFDYFYDAVKWASENGIASGTSNYTFSPDAVCTRAQTVTFLWRAAGSPMPRYRVSPFTDVNAYDYYYNAVLWAVEQGITTGLTATTFGPDETVTRGQVATFLYRAASAAKPNTFNPFTDVKATAYNYNAILWAYDNRITTGTSTTTFSPDASCTRAQIVTFLYRYYQGR